MPSASYNRCPLCKTALCAPEIEAIGSKKCPRCGAELWVLVGSDTSVFFLRLPGQTMHSFLASLLGPLYGLEENKAEEVLKRADSLDLVELVMEIEDKMGLSH
jgi:hypothetical protein